MRKAIMVGAAIVWMTIGLAGAAVFTPQTSQAQTSGNAEMVHAGSDIFSQNCLQCHSIVEGQKTFGPSLYRETRKPEGKKSTAEIRAILKDGKGKMPSFKDKLTPQQTDDLIAYIRTL